MIAYKLYLQLQFPEGRRCWGRNLLVSCWSRIDYCWIIGLLVLCLVSWRVNIGYLDSVVNIVYVGIHDK